MVSICCVWKIMNHRGRKSKQPPGLPTYFPTYSFKASFLTFRIPVWLLKLSQGCEWQQYLNCSFIVWLTWLWYFGLTLVRGVRYCAVARYGQHSCGSKRSHSCSKCSPEILWFRVVYVLFPRSGCVANWTRYSGWTDCSVFHCSYKDSKI